MKKELTIIRRTTELHQAILKVCKHDEFVHVQVVACDISPEIMKRYPEAAKWLKCSYKHKIVKFGKLIKFISSVDV